VTFDHSISAGVRLGRGLAELGLSPGSIEWVVHSSGTIRAKREWLTQAAANGWWVAFSHDVTAAAAMLDDGGKLGQTFRFEVAESAR
jgi:hypothetical protein